MYTVIKTIKGRQYRYLQRSWREGKKVRTQSICLGPVDGQGGRVKQFIDANFKKKPGTVHFDEEEFAANQAQIAAEEKATRDAHLTKLNEAYGLRTADTPTKENAPSDKGEGEKD